MLKQGEKCMETTPTHTTPPLTHAQPAISNQQQTPSIRSLKRRRDTGLPWFDDAYNATQGEASLWIAVITQAMMDALSQSRSAEADYHKTQAIRWLTEHNKDFIEVCLLANLCPDHIRRKAKKAIASPSAWRAAPGTGKRYQERHRRKQKKSKLSHSTQAHHKPEPESTSTVIIGPWR